MRICITGASGFIGQHILRRFAGDDVEILAVALDALDEEIQGNIRWLPGDLNDLDSLKPQIQAFDPEVLVHLAWQGIPDFSEAMSQHNLNQSIALLDFILEQTHCRKCIVSGSCFEYGRKKGPCRETDALETNSYFAWAKQSLYTYALMKCAQHKADLVWFRIFYAYGPGQRKASLVPMLLDTFRRGETPPVQNPFNRNDFVYASDIAEAFARSAQVTMPSGVYNLGSGSALSVHEVCRMIESQLAGTTQASDGLVEASHAKEDIHFWADMDKTRQALGWVPETTFEQGVAHCISELGDA